MRFKNGLAIFQRTSGRGTFNLVSFHSPHSMTWRWILSLDLPRRGEGRWLYWSRTPGRGQQKWCLQFLKFGLRGMTQEPMWYRDLYNKLQDRLHAERFERSPEPQVSAPSLTVIDGGQALH